MDEKIIKKVRNRMKDKHNFTYDYKSFWGKSQREYKPGLSKRQWYILNKLKGADDE